VPQAAISFAPQMFQQALDLPVRYSQVAGGIDLPELPLLDLVQHLHPIQRSFLNSIRSSRIGPPARKEDILKEL
jgi:hypothetical protein